MSERIVLVVDDEANWRDAYDDLPDFVDGCAVRKASSAEEAAQVAAEAPVWVCLVDLFLDGQSHGGSNELAQRLKSELGASWVFRVTSIPESVPTDAEMDGVFTKGRLIELVQRLRQLD